MRPGYFWQTLQHDLAKLFFLVRLNEASSASLMPRSVILVALRPLSGQVRLNGASSASLMPRPVILAALRPLSGQVPLRQLLKYGLPAPGNPTTA